MTLVVFENIVIDEQREPMVSLSEFPFINVPVYHRNGWSPSPDMFLRQGLAEKLRRIQETKLQPKGLQWIVFDAYRDRQVQANIYQYYWDKNSAENSGWDIERVRATTGTFVTIPSRLERIPPHASGGSVDLGLYNSGSGLIVPMGPDFDEFSPAVRTDYFEQSDRDAAIRDVRRFMNDILIEHGITSDEDEYFHKDFGNQKWAAHTNQTIARYGEVVSCGIEGGRIKTVYAIDIPLDQQRARIAEIEINLKLAHPSRQKIVPLPVPAQLVLQKLGRV